MLIDVEPNQPECLVTSHTAKEILDLQKLAGGGTDSGLRQQHRLVCERSNLANSIGKYVLECVRWAKIESVDADPRDVTRPGPPSDRRPDATAARRIDGPQPGNVARAVAA